MREPQVRILPEQPNNHERLAQMDRASVREAEGRRFDSSTAHTVPGSSNGKLDGFEPSDRGSSPCPGTNRMGVAQWSAYSPWKGKVGGSNPPPHTMTRWSEGKTPARHAGERGINTPTSRRIYIMFG
jgi:hypothetical protein